jgi:hypothetical protein
MPYSHFSIIALKRCVAVAANKKFQKLLEPRIKSWCARKDLNLHARGH